MTCRRSQAARTTAMAGGSFRNRRREPVYNRYVMRIDFLYWEDCPSHDEALRRLRAVLTEDEIAAEVQVTHVDTEELDPALRFPRSPPIRVDGRDIPPETVAADGRPPRRPYLLGDRAPP